MQYYLLAFKKNCLIDILTRLFHIKLNMKYYSIGRNQLRNTVLQESMLPSGKKPPDHRELTRAAAKASTGYRVTCVSCSVHVLRMGAFQQKSSLHSIPPARS